MNSHDEVYALIRDGYTLMSHYTSPDIQLDHAARLHEQQERVDILEAVLATERLVLAQLEVTCPAAKAASN